MAAEQLANVFVKETKAELKRLPDLVTLPRLEDPACAVCGKDSGIRCSRCKQEYYCGRDCQVKHWKEHKKFCDLCTSAEAGGAEGGR